MQQSDSGRKRRLRQHVNPLNFRHEVELPRWEERLARPELPMEVDVGCGHGDFLVGLAASRPDLNVVGLEIRRGMVERVQRRIEREELPNAAVVFCSANQHLRELFAPGSLQTVHVYFPDPWFKKRHHRRRVMTPELVADVQQALIPGGELRFMTDFGDYAAEVVELMSAQAEFKDPFGGAPAPPDAGRPRTHREEWHTSQGHAVHRHVWRKRKAPAGAEPVR